MRANPLSTKGFLMCLYNSISNSITLGYIKDIKEVVEQKNEKTA